MYSTPAAILLKGGIRDFFRQLPTTVFKLGETKAISLNKKKRGTEVPRF
jgi:hypothetical protein